MSKCKKLFVIGDSISCYYGKYLAPMLTGICEYDRKGGTHRLVNLDDCTDGINGGDSSMVLNYLKSVIDMDFFHPDFLMLNCGIHDTKTFEGKLQISPENYRENLKAVLSLAGNGRIKVIWVSTTPVNRQTMHWDTQEILRRQQDVDRYNIIADEIMRRHHVPVIDLHTFTVNLGPDIYLNKVDSVHFNDDAAKLQAAFIAGGIAQLIK